MSFSSHPVNFLMPLGVDIQDFFSRLCFFLDSFPYESDCPLSVDEGRVKYFTNHSSVVLFL